MINAELGYIIMILDAKVDEMGKMIAGTEEHSIKYNLRHLHFIQNYKKSFKVKL